MVFLSNYLKNEHTLKRFYSIIIAAICPAIFIVAASYAGCDKIVVVALFTIAMGFMGTFYPGMKVNPLDLSPNYAGSIMALTNGIGAITGVFAPYIAGVLTPNVSKFLLLLLHLNRKLSILFYCSHHLKNGALYFGYHL